MSKRSELSEKPLQLTESQTLDDIMFSSFKLLSCFEHCLLRNCLTKSLENTEKHGTNEIESSICKLYFAT